MSSDSQSDKLDKIVARARSDREMRDKGYRARALKMYPWVCGRCAREFTHENLRELTVHHRDHDHDNNPPDGSNWELLCIYCHDNEHSRYIDGVLNPSGENSEKTVTTHKALAGLADMMKKGTDKDR